MRMAGEWLPLRPLSIGEIFDRAVTLYVRNFALFTLIALAVILPLTLAQLFGTRGTASEYQQILAQIQHPQRATSTVATGADFTWLFLIFFLALVLAPFANVAIAAGVALLYRRQQPSWRTCYTLALRRSLPIFGTIFLEFVILGSVVIGGAIAFGAALVASVVAFRFVPAAGVVMIAILGMAWLLLVGVCYLAIAFAFDALVIENLSVFDAVGRGFARLFNRRELGRAVLIVLAFIAIYIGIYVLLITVVGLLIAFVHSMTLVSTVNAIASGLISLVATCFIDLLIAVYYFDVRIRREGLDMQAALDRLEPQAVP